MANLNAPHNNLKAVKNLTRWNRSWSQNSRQTSSRFWQVNFPICCQISRTRWFQRLIRERTRTRKDWPKILRRKLKAWWPSKLKQWRILSRKVSQRPSKRSKQSRNPKKVRETRARQTVETRQRKLPSFSRRKLSSLRCDLKTRRTKLTNWWTLSKIWRRLINHAPKNSKTPRIKCVTCRKSKQIWNKNWRNKKSCKLVSSNKNRKRLPKKLTNRIVKRMLCS